MGDKYDRLDPWRGHTLTYKPKDGLVLDLPEMTWDRSPFNAHHPSEFHKGHALDCTTHYEIQPTPPAVVDAPSALYLAVPILAIAWIWRMAR